MSTRRAIVPFVLLLLSALIGCGSSGSKSTGAGGTTGTAGNDASADTGDADATQDATVAETSLADASDARGDTATAEDAAADGGTDAIPPCPLTNDQGPKLDPVTFCKNVLHACVGLRESLFKIPDAYDTEEKCEAAWAANTTAVNCRSYHLCNATRLDPKTYCPFVFGQGGQCTD
jgi:hypothetical protein